MKNVPYILSINYVIRCCTLMNILFWGSPKQQIPHKLVFQMGVGIQWILMKPHYLSQLRHVHV